MTATPTTSAAPSTGTSTDDITSPVGSDRYLVPDAFTRRVMNPIVARLTRWGLSVWGSRVLTVPGRMSGEPRSVPVNVLAVDDRRYLVAPRGETQWVRNARAAGRCSLRVGRRDESVGLLEVDDAAKPAILRAYLRRWKWEVGQFFDGVGADSPDAELAAIAPNHPVFEIVAG